MKEQNLEQLWREIAADLDQDEDIELDQYLQQKGINLAPVYSLNKQVQHLVEDTFTTTEITDDQLKSKYKITQQIDSGGQSDIYLAERSDGVYQQTVVIKFISERFDQTALKQQFLQEMQLLADLRHPGVVTIIDGNITNEGQPWLVLEFIDGPHIDQYCQQQQLNNQGVVGLMMNLCETLQFVHRREVLHKDLKPSNVLVKLINGVPFPVLIDFGIAMQQGQHADLAFGTRGYSAPEQVSGHTVDQRTDLFALGVLFGQLLLKAINQHIDIHHPEALQQALKKYAVPVDLQKVVAKLTAVEPSKRYQSADALRSDLNQWQLGFPLSFDNHKLSKVLAKTVRRHPWATLVLLAGLFLTVFFSVKYTRDIQHLQQLTIAEKHETDELMNFMLNDLYENLERIGRIDVLQSVAEKSVTYLAKQDPVTLDQAGHLQTAKAYTNTGRVFDYLEQSLVAQKMFTAAEAHLNQIKKHGNESLDYYAQLAQLRVYQSQVLSSSGQELATEQVLQQAIQAMHEVINKDPGHNPMVLWEANLELSYHLMEYAKQQAAENQIQQTIQLADEQLQFDPDDADWLYANSHSFQLKAWYELDFGDINQGIVDVIQAIEFAQASIKQDSEDLKKQNNERILHNQLAYFYLENGQTNEAQKAVLLAVNLGEALKTKAPFNQEFEREQAYSFSTAGEVYQLQGETEKALEYYQSGLKISQRNYAKDQQNYSAANDLAVDSLLVADLLQQTGQQQEANALFTAVEKLMVPVHAAEPNNKYYAHTLLVTKLQLKQFEAAKKLFDLAVENDVVDTVVEKLLAENELNWLPKE
jgi:serine/threonine protein kinase